MNGCTQSTMIRPSMPGAEIGTPYGAVGGEIEEASAGRMITDAFDLRYDAGGKVVPRIAGVWEFGLPNP